MKSSKTIAKKSVENDNHIEANSFHLNIISKYRNQLYGFAILWIVFFHAWAIDLVDYSFGHKVLLPLKAFMNSGNVGVDVFLFLSGICLYFSYFKKPNSYEFLKKRMIRIILPVWIIDGLYWLIRYVFIEHADWSSFLNRMLLMQFWEKGDSTIWFVSCIALFYFLYPYIYEYLFGKEKNRVWFRGIILLGISYLGIICFSKVNPSLYQTVEIALTRFPVFLLGCMTGKMIYEKKTLPSLFAIVPFLVTLLFFIVVCLKPFGGYRMRFFYLVGGVSIAYSVAILFAIFDKCGLTKKILSFFSFIGSFSLELYLSHIMLNQVYRLTPLYVKGDLSRYLVVAGISVLIAYLASKVRLFLSEKVLKN